MLPPAARFKAFPIEIMKTLYVNLGKRRYPIMVGQGLIGVAGALLAGQGFHTSPIVVTNQTILRLHGSMLMRSIEQQFGPPRLIVIGDGERFKTHATLLKIYNGMFRVHADRRSWILAFGGGVIGDIAGFAAATFMRGIPFVMMPTTLLAQVDSSIGGKVGINVAQGKNLIGAFYQPAAVLSDTGVLRTLPKRELSAGLYEIVKCGAIRSKSLLNYLHRRLPEILQCRAAEMDHIVVEAARIKADVVASDEREGGLRMILNYGHTIGHAFEAATNYKKFKHGEAVAWGMIAALEYGGELGLLGGKESAVLTHLIYGMGGLPPLRGISFENLWAALIRDKKFRSGEIRMVFLRRLGEAEIRADIDASSLRKFLKRFLAGSRSIV
jgi:3-dehydroquinate synthase